ncbi:MAG: hypothetical protein PHY64_04965 [Eubacteriales bacterium]|nr:hypothetical protein [Eubacteriales bacterium]
MKDYWSKFLENGVILAFFTGVAYYLTYLRLDGALAAYALPDELIEIDAPDIIATLIDLIYKFWPVLMIPALGLMIGRMYKDAEIVRLWRFSIAMVTAVVFSVFLVNRFESKNWILLGIMLFEWAETAFKMLVQSKAQKGLRAKWTNYRQAAQPSHRINERMAVGIGYLAVAIAVMYVLSGSVMEHAATTQLNREDYFVARDYNDQVVVYENDKCYVLMARDGDALTNSYEIVRYDHIGKLDYVHTGVLSLPRAYPIFD